MVQSKCGQGVESKQPVPKSPLCHSTFLDRQINSLEVKKGMEFCQGTEPGKISRFCQEKFSTIVAATATAAFAVE